MNRRKFLSDAVAAATVAVVNGAVAGLPAAQAAGSRSLKFRNEHWNNGVNLEVRGGSFQECEKNPVIATFRLAKGQSRTISTTAVRVCYRRDADPDHPDGRWTVWYGDEISSDHDINI